MSSSTQSTTTWNNPQRDERIDRNIERHRRADARIRITDTNGNPVPGARVHVEQIDSSFHFGANLFMLDGYPTPELNARYEQRFCDLFNAATVPFYWAGLDPVRGQRRLAADSPALFRRPPPDRAVAFCQEHGLKMHGHVLVWDHAEWSIPAWVPSDFSEMMALWEKRVREIGERYGSVIKRWDVANEVVPDRSLPISRPMPAGYTRTAFEWAERYLPADCQLDINELSEVWRGLMPRYVALIRSLVANGARVRGIGLQCHLCGHEITATLAGQRYRPDDMLAVLDAAAAFGVPVHISEVTVPPPTNDAAGNTRQAQVARNFYRLWFSHPAVTGITWWNVLDGGQAAGENEKLFVGILDQNLAPKPAYATLRKLIREDWQTHLRARADENGLCTFRGFPGRYRLTIHDANGHPLGAGTVKLGSNNDESDAELHLNASQKVDMQ
ncbi:MAG: endo-1,4-beta-xylanase [Opitutaceae bacterium]|jgi:GH35 family endo-1,4-beta-xylanase|nr:endo-1,4-beta-xylanase [Opitutaceae bacterium]